MESIFETILTNAGMAGALLLLCGWALWKKDQQVRALQEAAVQRERERAEIYAAKIEQLTTEYAEKLAQLADARTNDLSRVLGEERVTNEKNAGVMLEVNTTLTQILGVMAEIRADVRRRRSPSGTSFPPGGGA